jgi:hypothetical protein
MRWDSVARDDFLTAVLDADVEFVDLLLTPAEISITM